MGAHFQLRPSIIECTIIIDNGFLGVDSQGLRSSDMGFACRGQSATMHIYVFTSAPGTIPRRSHPLRCGGLMDERSFGKAKCRGRRLPVDCVNVEWGDQAAYRP